MITLENKTIGASFKYEDEQYNFNGNYTANESDKSLISLTISFNVNGAYKGNAFLEGPELKYNFTNVKPAEVDLIIQHCETCVEELKAAINA